MASSDEFVKEAERQARLVEQEMHAGADQSFPLDLDPRYQVLSTLGQGGMGTVYKVQDATMGKTFAIKVLRKELSENTQSVRRFEQEIKAASELTHENLVSVYGHGRTTSGLPYLIMDYVDGASLAEVLKNEGKLSETSAIETLTQVCEALSHAHKRNVVHRDLKPSNIMLKKTASGAHNVLVLDFGIAKILPSEGADYSNTNLTQTGEIFGSPLYMSPEQCENNPQDQRSDIYAFGCVMYETLTGVQPFCAENPVKMILKHINLEPKPMSSQPGMSKLPQALDTIVLKCLEKKPENRYKSVDDLLNDLRCVAAGKPISAKPRVKKQRSTKSKLVMATVLSVVFGVVLAVVAEGFKLYSVLNPDFGGALNPYNDARSFDSKSYIYFVRGDYEKAIPLLEFGIATYRERIASDKKSRDTKQLMADETLLAENLQHVGKCYLELGKRASLTDAEESKRLMAKAGERYEDALKFWRRFDNLKGTMAVECVGEYAYVLKMLGRTKELDELNAWRRGVSL